MSNIKNIRKRLSVDLAKSVEISLQKYYGLFKIIEDKEKYSLYLVDKEDNSDIYFGIIKETNDSSGHFIHFSLKPTNNSKIESSSSSTKISDFQNFLNNWLENLKFYEEGSVLNDPIIRGYRDEFYMDYKITDKNADFEGFSYLQQKQLSEFFEKVTEGINALKDTNNSEFIDILKNDISELNSMVTSETKNGFMKKFSYLLAKARKGSLKICDYIIKELAKVLIKEGTDFAFNYLKDNIHNLPANLPN